MKRRTFILATTTVALGVISIPVIRYYNKRTKNYDPLIMPFELGRFCDEKAIRAIGDQYRKQVPRENDKTILKELLLSGNDGKRIPGTDKIALMELLDKKVYTDFADNKIHILTGWVISTTEARQCALFSLT
jgi:hypothetical protein